MTRLRVWVNGALRLDAPAHRADPTELARAVRGMAACAAGHDHSLAVVIDHACSGHGDSHVCIISKILARV